MREMQEGEAAEAELIGGLSGGKGAGKSPDSDSIDCSDSDTDTKNRKSGLEGKEEEEENEERGGPSTANTPHADKISRGGKNAGATRGLFDFGSSDSENSDSNDSNCGCDSSDDGGEASKKSNNNDTSNTTNSDNGSGIDGKDGVSDLLKATATASIGANELPDKSIGAPDIYFNGVPRNEKVDAGGDDSESCGLAQQHGQPEREEGGISEESESVSSRCGEGLGPTGKRGRRNVGRNKGQKGGVVKDKSSNAFDSAPPADKGARRRQRQALKAAKAGGGGKKKGRREASNGGVVSRTGKGDEEGVNCRVCGKHFPSRSKLFAHVKAEGHALLAT